MAVRYEYYDQRRAPEPPQTANGNGNGNAKRDTVEFEFNVPVQVAIKYSEPRMVDGRYGTRCMYSLVDGRVMFVDPDVATKINMMEINVRELFWICKRGGQKGQKTQWDVWLDPAAENARAAAEAPSVEAQLRQSINQANNQRHPIEPPAAAPKPAPAPAVHLGWAQLLISTTNALTDAYAAALSYARQQHGDAVKPEDVRALLTTAFISQSRNGGPNVA